MTQHVPNATAVKHFLVKQILSQIDGGPPQAELIEAIGEIELETQIAGASFIKVDLIDPDWTIVTSGMLDIVKGLLKAIEVEFPEGSEWNWRLCAVELTTDRSQPQILTFEDAIIARLRDGYGTKSGTTTSAQWVKALVDEVNLNAEANREGLPLIRFVCPAIPKPKSQ